MRKDKYISELITIYRRLKRGTHPEFFNTLNETVIETEDDINSIEGINSNNIKKESKFAEHKNLHLKKYIYHDTDNLLINTDNIYTEWPTETKPAKKYWLNIFDPQDCDFEYLQQKFGVNYLTIHDLKHGGSKEKIETFTDYTFIVLKLIGRNEDEVLDMNFNIILYKNRVITTHDKKWSSITDIVNFLTLANKRTFISPDWIFFSVIIELLQDVNYYIDNIRPKIEMILKGTHLHYDYSHSHNLREVQKLEEKQDEHVDIGHLKRNFALSFELVDILRFIKPKIEILTSFGRRSTQFDQRILKHLNASHHDFLSQEKEIKEMLKTLERSQDLLLALINVDITKEGNMMNLTMKRFTFITLVFLPIQTVAGVWGMNCKVPGQFSDGKNNSFFWFFGLIISTLFATFIYFKMFKKGSQNTVQKKFQVVKEVVSGPEESI
ncbi:putative metal ion transporter C17A12.14 [Cucumispora dikerogammari]|nr:putative metal ion transporter C17A12.14 [Cucumispora dikerogammari]